MNVRGRILLLFLTGKSRVGIHHLLELQEGKRRHRILQARLKECKFWIAACAVMVASPKLNELSIHLQE